MARNQRRVCSEPGCPTITSHTRCDQHSDLYGTTHGTTAQRGYGSHHQRDRRAWAPHVATGQVDCRRCGELIEPHQPWHLGHDDTRTTTAPEHRTCNLTAARHR